MTAATDCVADTISTRHEGWPGLAELIKSNAEVNPGRDPVLAQSFDEAGAVDRLLLESALVARFNKLLGDPIDPNRQLCTLSATIATQSAQMISAGLVQPPSVVISVPERAAAGGGLWTSTVLDARTSWMVWIQLGGQTASFLDTRSWMLRPRRDINVFEIGGANDWVRLCSGYPRPGGTFDILPNWSGIAEEYDAVHVTLAGSIATQGISYVTADGYRIAPPYFDIESTWWPRWVFSEVNETDLGGDFSGSHLYLGPALKG